MLCILTLVGRCLVQINCRLNNNALGQEGICRSICCTLTLGSKILQLGVAQRHDRTVVVPLEVLRKFHHIAAPNLITSIGMIEAALPGGSTPCVVRAAM